MLTECPNNVFVSSLPAKPGPPADRRRWLEDIERPLTTTTVEHGETFVIIVGFSQSVSV